MNKSCISSLLQIGCCSMSIMSCAIRKSRSSTEYHFLSNPTVDGALKSIFGTPSGEVEDFLIFRMFQIRAKTIQMCFYDRHKSEYKTLAMKLSSWIKDSTFYQIRKEVYLPRKIKFFKPRLKCFYWLLSG